MLSKKVSYKIAHIVRAYFYKNVVHVTRKSLKAYKRKCIRSLYVLGEVINDFFVFILHFELFYSEPDFLYNQKFMCVCVYTYVWGCIYRDRDREIFMLKNS